MSTSSLYRGSLTTILLKLLEEHGKMYGYEITQKVKELTQGDLVIKEGALYPSLHKLEASGFLTVRAQRVDNRIRKYYEITPQGKEEKTSRLAELDEFLANMQRIINPKLSY